MAIDFPSAFSGDNITALVARAHQPRDPYADFAYLAESRGETVRRHRSPGPHGGVLGPWYRAEDWDDAGNLIATGRAAAMALDPWASDRADRIAGKPRAPTTMPPIQPLRFEGVEYPDVEPVADTVDSAAATPVEHPESTVERAESTVALTPESTDPEAARREYQRVYARDRKLAAKLGISVAELRQRAAVVASPANVRLLVPVDKVVGSPAVGAPSLGRGRA